MKSDDIARSIARETAEIRASVCLVYGPFSSGKTYVLHEVDRLLRRGTAPHPLIVTYSCSSADTGYEPLSELVKEVNLCIAPRRFRWLLLWLWQRKFGLIKFVASVISLILGWFGLEIKGLADTVEKLESAAGKTNTSDSSVFPHSEVRKLIELLSNAAKKLRAPAVLLLDKVEELPEPGIQLLTIALEDVPDKIRVVMTLNTEADGYSTRRDLLRLRAKLQYRPRKGIYLLEGKTAVEIQDWKKAESGVPISIEVATQAHQQSRGGRAGLLAPWIKSTSVDPSDIADSKSRLLGILNQRFSALDDTAKRVLVLQVLVHPHSVEFHAIGKVLGVTVSEIEGARQTLRDLFISDEGQLQDDSIAEFVRDRVGPGVLEAYADDFLERAKGVRAISDPVRRGLEFSKITNRLSRPDFDHAEALDYIRACLRRGALSAAGLALKRVDQVGRVAEQPRSFRIRHLQLRADWQGQQGDYGSAIQSLKQAELLGGDKVDIGEIQLDIGEKLYRLNDYAEAAKRLRRAMRLARETKRNDLSLKAVVRFSGILVDVGKYSSALRLMQCLLRWVERNDVSARERCHNLRFAARIHALFPGQRDRALELANAALNVAERETESLRDQGNSLYALGDSLRHAGRNPESAHTYRRALRIADDTGNYDLAIYSLLGLCALHATALDRLSLERDLAELKERTEGTDQVERRYGDLFQAVAAALANQPIDQASVSLLRDRFRSFRRTWAVKLIDRLELGGWKLRASDFEVEGGRVFVF